MRWILIFEIITASALKIIFGGFLIFNINLTSAFWWCNFALFLKPNKWTIMKESKHLLKKRTPFLAVALIILGLVTLFSDCEKDKTGTCTITCLHIFKDNTTLKKFNVTSKECARLRKNEYDKCDCWCFDEFIEN